MKLNIPQTIFDEVAAHAVAEQPRECCGLLGGARRAHEVTARSRYPLRNLAAQPETQFFAAPADLFAAVRRMRERREDLLAIYHSHPRGPAFPSETDLALAFYPEALFLIVALAPQRTLRAFQLSRHKVLEVEIVVTP